MITTWAEIVAPPKTRPLRQFAVLWLVCLTGIAAWRAWHGHGGPTTDLLGATGLVIGGLGICYPRAVRWVYTVCMIATFPVSVVVSQVALASVYFLVFTPVGLVFRIVGRDPLRLRRGAQPTYWTPTTARRDHEDYLRQS